MNNTFFNLKLDLSPDIINMSYDILRMSTIQLVTQIMFYMNSSSLSLFNETFVKTFIFINISIVFYYLVVSKLLSITSDNFITNTVPSSPAPPPVPYLVPPPATVTVPVSTPPITKQNNSKKGSTPISDLNK